MNKYSGSDSDSSSWLGNDPPGNNDSGDEVRTKKKQRPKSSKEKAADRLVEIKDIIAKYKPVSAFEKLGKMKPLIANHWRSLDSHLTEMETFQESDVNGRKRITKNLLQSQTIRDGWVALNDMIIQQLDTANMLGIELFGAKTAGLTTAMQLLFRKYEIGRRCDCPVLILTASFGILQNISSM